LDLEGGEDFMANVKCNNCGTLFPEEAAFCPECGAPKKQEQKKAQAQPATNQQPQTQPQPQPVRQMPKPAPGAQMKELADTFFSKFMIMLGVAIGILLLWIGALLRNFAGDAGSTINGIFSPTAYAGIGLLTFGGGFLNKNIDKYVRMGMIIVGGLMLAFGISSLGGFNIGGLINPF
jgi:hypothetical protein